MAKQLYYVTVDYGTGVGPVVKSGYVMAESAPLANEWAREKVRTYPGTVKIWTSEAHETDSNDKDSFEFEQRNDHWDHPDPESVFEEEEDQG